GKRIMVTRARHQASELSELIEELGGEALEFPTIEMKRPEDPEVLKQIWAALQQLERYDWILFTSVNGVEFFFDYMKERAIDIRRMVNARIAAVGPKTAEALQKRGLIVEELPEDFVGE